MMRTFALVLTMSFVTTCGALAVNPTLTAGGGGTNVLDSGRTVFWSEPPNLDGLIASSEIIGQYTLESEIANDFVLPSFGTVRVASWWGGYFSNNSCDDIGVATNWNIRFYEDGGCMPGNTMAEFVSAFANEKFMYCQAGIYPIFCYWISVTVPVNANTLYWFGAQAADHPFPPQVGRLAAAEVVGCESVFKSAFFSYPNWTPASIVFGVPYDASQEFGDDPSEVCSASTPTINTTWGDIKALYR